jgi:hypothetical protein
VNTLFAEEPKGCSLGHSVTAFIPGAFAHPALRATFFPLCGEKERGIDAVSVVGLQDVVRYKS